MGGPGKEEGPGRTGKERRDLSDSTLPRPRLSLQRARAGQGRLAHVSLAQPAHAANAPSEAKADRTRAPLLMSTDKAPYGQTKAKLLVWKHLQLITRASGCFRNHLTLTASRDHRPLGQAESGLTLPCSAGGLPFPCRPGPWHERRLGMRTLTSSLSLTTHRPAVTAVIPILQTSKQAQRSSDSSLVCRGEGGKLARSLTRFWPWAGGVEEESCSKSCIDSPRGPQAFWGGPGHPSFSEGPRVPASVGGHSPLRSHWGTGPPTSSPQSTSHRCSCQEAPVPASREVMTAMLFAPDLIYTGSSLSHEAAKSGSGPVTQAAQTTQAGQWAEPGRGTPLS